MRSGTGATAVVVAMVTAMCLATGQGAEACLQLPSVPNPFGLPLKPLFGACTGNGVCAPDNSTCVCRAGFTGRSDFINTEGEDCQINNTVIRGLWGFSLFMTVTYWAISFPKVRTRWRQFVETKRAKENAGHTYTLRQNKAVAAILCNNLLLVPSMGAMAIVMLVNPLERVGLTVGATLCFAGAKCGFYLTVALFQPALIGSLLRGQSRSGTSRILRINVIFSGIFSLMGCMTGLLPLVTLIGSDGKDDLARIVFYFIFILTFLQIIGLGIQAFWVKIKITKALDSSYAVSKSQRTLDIKKALVAVQNENVVQTSIQGVIYGCFVFLPYLANYHAYFLPVGWLAYTVLGKKLAFTTVDDSTSRGSKTERSTNARETGSSFTRKNPAIKTYNPDDYTQVDSSEANRYRQQITSFVEGDAGFASEASEDDGYV